LHNGEACVGALSKAIKTAAQCMDPCVQVQLFTDVLNQYIYFAEQGCAQVCARPPAHV
jgi:vacuolar protein sorting-associated protein 35